MSVTNHNHFVLAFAELLSKGNELPTVEEIEDVWNVPDVPQEPVQPMVDDYEVTDEYREAKAKYDTEKAEYDTLTAQCARKLEVLLWWTDNYLPGVVGLQFWGSELRPHHLMTDLKLVPGDTSKEEKMLVTSTSEAFAMTLYKNCRTKWINTYEWKATHKACDSEPPKWDRDDESTHKYHSIWSNSRTGSAEGAGWNSDAVEYVAECGASIRESRSQDKANDYKIGKLAMALIKEENNIGEDGKKIRGRKRAARPVRETAPARKSIKITIVDE